MQLTHKPLIIYNNKVIINMRSWIAMLIIPGPLPYTFNI